MSINKRFNDLIKQLGFYITVFYSSNQVLKVYFDEDSKPVTMQQIRERFSNYCKIHNITQTEDFFLTAQLPVYKVHK